MVFRWINVLKLIAFSESHLAGVKFAISRLQAQDIIPILILVVALHIFLRLFQRAFFLLRIDITWLVRQFIIPYAPYIFVANHFRRSQTVLYLSWRCASASNL